MPTGGDPRRPIAIDVPPGQGTVAPAGDEAPQPVTACRDRLAAGPGIR